MISFCIVSTNYYKYNIGGAEIQNHYICQELNNNGYEVHYIFYRDFLFSKIQAKENNIYLHTIYIPRQKLFNRFIRIKLFLEKMQLKYILKRITPEIIYLRSINTFLPSITSINKSINAKIYYAISTDGQVQKGFWAKRYNELFERKMLISLKETTKVIFQTSFQKDSFEKNYSHTGKIIRNGHPPKKNIEITESKPVIVWVGNLKRIKHPEIFLDLVKMLPEEFKSVMIGKSNRLFRDMILETKRQRINFEYLDYQPNNVVEEIVANSFLLVSTSETEGFSNTFIEAWKYGKPVLSFVDPDNLITRFKLGKKCSDVNDICNEILELLSNNGKYKNISKNCESFFNNSLTIDKMVKEIINI